MRALLLLIVERAGCQQYAPPSALACRRLLEELSDDDFCMDDGHHLKPREVHSYLCRVLYNRRNKCAWGPCGREMKGPWSSGHGAGGGQAASPLMSRSRRRFDPLWNSIVVGGFYEGKPFLGTVGMIGTNCTDAHLATGARKGACSESRPLGGLAHWCAGPTCLLLRLLPHPAPLLAGFGNHLARPLMREKHRPDMSEEEATALMHECLKVCYWRVCLQAMQALKPTFRLALLQVCYYRDKNSINKFQLAKVTAEGVTISGECCCMLRVPATTDTLRLPTSQPPSPLLQSHLRWRRPGTTSCLRTQRPTRPAPGRRLRLSCLPASPCAPAVNITGLSFALEARQLRGRGPSRLLFALWLLASCCLRTLGLGLLGLVVLRLVPVEQRTRLASDDWGHSGDEAGGVVGSRFHARVAAAATTVAATVAAAGVRVHSRAWMKVAASTLGTM